MSKIDGGAAFPSTTSPFVHRGLSKRDYFAGQALAGMIASDSSIDRTKINKPVRAYIAYEFANAMLKERDK